MSALTQVQKKSEGESLPSSSALSLTTSPTKAASKWKRKFLAGAALCSIALVHLGELVRSRGSSGIILRGEVSSQELCPQAKGLYPRENGELYDWLNELYGTRMFVEKAATWLGEAVKVKTETYDDMGEVGEDERWEKFGSFHDYLEKAFPLLHETLRLEKVNTYGLVYHWKGSDESLEPVLLAAHQDVVPVNENTWDEWEYPPYSGHFDRETQSIYGRGSIDDKSGLIGLMITIETLLEHSFELARTIVLASGFDEESNGLHGARHISNHLLDEYGEYSFAMLVDEGGGYAELFGSAFAVPAVAEKGYLDTVIKMASPGGHSSVPPPHTTIGMLSAAIVALEDDPFPVHLTRSSPVYDTMLCTAAHVENVPKDLRELIERSVHSDEALVQLQNLITQGEDTSLKNSIRTTLAATVMGGGFKANALPDDASAIVNYRIAPYSSVQETKEHNIAALIDLAREFNLSFTAFGKQISEEGEPAWGVIELSDPFESASEPSPISPTDSEAYRILSGSIKATYSAHRHIYGSVSVQENRPGDEIIVSPGLMSGTTDTKHYWNLTENIFRYGHWNGGHSPGIHTVNEHIRVTDFVEIIRFYTTLILNVDEAVGL